MVYVNVKLNEEIIRMRSVIKRAKVLVINHLIRHAKQLRNKKGSEEQKTKHKGRAERLLEEIEIIKDLKFDIVTLKALQEDVSFDNVTKPSATIEERAIARIICHKTVSQPIKKIKENYTTDDFQQIQLLREYRSRTRNSRKYDETRDDDGKDENISDGGSGSDAEERVETEQTESDTKESGIKVPESGSEKDTQEPSKDKVYKKKGRKNVDFRKNPKTRKMSKRNEDLDESKGSDSEVKEKDRLVRSTAKCDLDAKLIPSYRDSILSDSYDDDADRETKRKKMFSSEYISDMLEFKVMGKKALQSTFCGKLSCPGSDVTRSKQQYIKRENRSRDVRLPDVNKESSKRSYPTKSARDFKERRKEENPSKADLGVRNLPPRKRKEEKEMKKAPSSEKIHPSWEASKKRRQQESTIVEFKGQKITFDDD